MGLTLALVLALVWASVQWRSRGLPALIAMCAAALLVELFTKPANATGLTSVGSATAVLCGVLLVLGLIHLVDAWSLRRPLR